MREPPLAPAHGGRERALPRRGTSLRETDHAQVHHFNPCLLRTGSRSGGLLARPCRVGAALVAGTASGALAIAFMTGVSMAGDWLTFLQFAYGVPFGQVDPIFGRDVSFYVFRFPVWDELQARMFMLVLLSLVGSFGVYLISGNVVLENRWGFAMWPRVEFHSRVRLHLALLVSLLLLLLVGRRTALSERIVAQETDEAYGRLAVLANVSTLVLYAVQTLGSADREPRGSVRLDLSRGDVDEHILLARRAR